jgi:Leucine-rich repeat (LRR) protein
MQNRTHGLLEDTLSIRKVDLSYNRIPFVTGKMFPESRWQPYRVEWVDLSHNHMPVLTKELLIGTKHLLYLNVSSNMLNDVRKGVINNLTSLEQLDISNNFLPDKILTDARVGNLTNLTVFRLASNRFTQLPMESIMRMEKLKVLDIRKNKERDSTNLS